MAVQKADDTIAEHQAHVIGLASCDHSKAVVGVHPLFPARMSKAGVKRAFRLLLHWIVSK